MNIKIIKESKSAKNGFGKYVHGFPLDDGKVLANTRCNAHIMYNFGFSYIP
jgi:hypothetical protein